jgi:hypothetical protein
MAAAAAAAAHKAAALQRSQHSRSTGAAKQQHITVGQAPQTSV